MSRRAARRTWIVGPGCGLAAIFLLVVAPNAWACVVCGGSDARTADAFMRGTLLLSVMPLAMIGGVVALVARRALRGSRTTRVSDSTEHD